MAVHNASSSHWSHSPCSLADFLAHPHALALLTGPKGRLARSRGIIQKGSTAQIGTIHCSCHHPLQPGAPLSHNQPHPALYLRTATTAPHSPAAAAAAAAAAAVPTAAPAHLPFPATSPAESTDSNATPARHLGRRRRRVCRHWQQQSTPLLDRHFRACHPHRSTVRLGTTRPF